MSESSLPVVQPVPFTRYALWRFVRPLLKVRKGDFDGLRRLLEAAPDAFIVHTPIYRVIFLNDPELIEEMLVSKYKCYHKDPGFAALRRLMGDGLLTSEDETHLRHRRMIQPAFHKDRIDAYAEHMVRLSHEGMARWQDGATLDLSAEMMGITLAIISKTMFDADVADEAAEIYDAMNTVIGYSERYVVPAIGRLFDALPLRSSRRVRASEQLLNDVIYRFIREHRASGRDHGDLLSMLLMSQAEDGSGGMSDQQVRDESITLFLAGHETTAIALSWTWYLLSQNPDVEAKLHAELDAVFAGGRDATASDVPRLKYTRQVFAESMRLFPPAPGFGRQAVRDNTLGPYAVRKGDIITVAAMAVQRQAKWFPDPDRFDPDRWLPEAAAARPRFSYFPFGGGVRKCIGEPFAWMEGILLLATMAQQWRFELAPDARIGMDAKITLRPRYGMRMILHRRDTGAARSPAPSREAAQESSAVCIG